MDTTDRYHRQRILPEIGGAGQDLLRAGHALIVGVGALGTHAAGTLARAGVGRLTLIDRDVVEWSNLHRQTLFTEADARDSAPKALAAARAIAAINSGVRVEPIIEDLTARNARRLIAAAEPSIILDCTDNFQTRFLLNDLAVAAGLPLVYAGVVGVTGLTTTILPAATRTDARAATACLRCLFDDAPAPGASPTCDTAGVLGPAVAIIAGLQAVEAIKVITNQFDRVRRSLLEVNAWTGVVREIDTARARRVDCPCCARRVFDWLDRADAAGDAAIICGAGSVQITPTRDASLDLADLARRLAPFGDFQASPHLLRGSIRESGVELTVFVTGRAIVKGAADAARARAVYARYIGS